MRRLSERTMSLDSATVEALRTHLATPSRECHGLTQGYLAAPRLRERGLPSIRTRACCPAADEQTAHTRARHILGEVGDGHGLQFGCTPLPSWTNDRMRTMSSLLITLTSNRRASGGTVDTPGLGPGPFGGAGSTPASRTPKLTSANAAWSSAGRRVRQKLSPKTATERWVWCVIRRPLRGSAGPACRRAVRRRLAGRVRRCRW
jgi:hypothetical protein